MRQVVIVNDILGGCLGEKKVFWNYMLESIPNIRGVDWGVVGQVNFEMNAKKYIDMNCDRDAIIIQNATFLGKIDDSRYTICFLQDNLRGMGRPNQQQEYNLAYANKIVANSNQTAEAYKEYKTEVISIGIDSELFCPKNKSEMRAKYAIPQGMPVGIFVGDFSDVKGWDQVRQTIESRSDVFFILVTKNPNDRYESKNSKTFNVIPQDVIAELHSCSDFFILGSPVETQCLAALEASFSGLPVIMNRTGLYMDWDDSYMFGCFGLDFPQSIDYVLTHDYDTRSAIFKKGLSITDMINKWKKVLESI